MTHLQSGAACALSLSLSPFSVADCGQGGNISLEKFGKIVFDECLRDKPPPPPAPAPDAATSQAKL